MKNRYLKEVLKKDLHKKILILTGPRQSGKTVLSQMLGSHTYFNFDIPEDRFIIEERSWTTKGSYMIFDEIHKKDQWKSFLKGIYDDIGVSKTGLVVTGSAKMSAYKKIGDSLAGRFFSFHLYPFDLKEIKYQLKEKNLEKSFDKLLEKSGFPEPYLDPSPHFYGRWKQSHQDIIIKEDLRDLTSLQDLKAIENLIEHLRRCVGGTVNHSSLSQKIKKSDKTVKRWLESLESLFVIFKVTPYTHNILRSIQKQPKYYFYDSAQVIGSTGDKLENLVAVSLMKECHFQRDVFGREMSLFYLRDKEKNEVDFLVVEKGEPKILIETKWKNDKLSSSLKKISKYFSPHIKKIQLVRELRKEKNYEDGTQILSAVQWLSDLKI